MPPFPSSPRPPGRVPVAYIVSASLCAAVAAGLCFVPLLDLLGYESSLVLSLCASAAGVALGVSTVTRARAALSPADADAADAHPARAVLGLCLRAALLTEAMLVLPLLVLLLNGLRVRNCAPLGGLSFYLLLPVCSGPCSAALGTVCGLLTRRPWRGALLGLLGILASLLWAGWRFLSSPAIYAYDPFFGYFPGALYDEAVAIEQPLYFARLEHALLGLLALLLAAVLLDGRRLRCPLRPAVGRLAGRGLLLLLTALVATAGAAVFGLRGQLGIHRDAASVERVLSAERRTAHFVLRYAPGGPVAREIDLIAQEHEFQYGQLRRTLGATPTWRPARLALLLGLINIHEDWRGGGGEPIVVSYLFDSAQRKQELMGASHTYIAKPWRREIYLQHESWPHPVLKHELAHIFAGAAGDPLLHISIADGLPRPGMIEGVAVAAEWRGGKLTPHQAVKAMREAHLEPPLERILGLSFLTLSSGRAYTVAGSFCRYLLDRFGPQRLLAVYRAGGTPAAFQLTYGATFASLSADWSRFIDRQGVARAEREVQREMVRRPPVFKKVCAHEMALRRQAAWAAQSRGDTQEAARLLSLVCSEDPGEPQHLLELARLWWEADRPTEAAAAAERLLAHPALTPVLEGQAQALLGDLSWLRWDPAAARRHYEAAQALPADEGAARLLTAKLMALPGGSAGAAGPIILNMLIDRVAPKVPRSMDGRGRAGGTSSGPFGEVPGERDRALYLLDLIEAERLAPGLALVPYLLGRQLYGRGGFREAVAALKRSLDLGLQDQRFTQQAQRLLGQALLRSGQRAAAREVFMQVRDSLPQSENEPEQGQRVELSEWVARAEFQ